MAEKSFDGIPGALRSILISSINKGVREKEMTHIADMKMALLAALIVLTSVVCTRDEDKLAQVDPVLRNAPLIETQRLAG